MDRERVEMLTAPERLTNSTPITASVPVVGPETATIAIASPAEADSI
jgi:hypothetical protein